MNHEVRMHDISRLCEALGLDPATYVSFDRQVRSVPEASGKAGQRPAGDGKAGGSGIAATAASSAALSVREGQAARRGMAHASAGNAAYPSPVNAAHAASHRAGHETIQPMQLALLSLAGGSGKTTLAAVLGNVLRGRGHSVLLADHSLYNSLQTLFGLSVEAHTAMSFAVGGRTGSSLPLLSRYDEARETPDFDTWFEAIAARTEFTFIDGLTDAVAQGRALISGGARVLIPVVPDVVSAMSAVTLDKALNTPWPGRMTYVLNRFDENEPLHRDVRIWLREGLGARLLPFEIPNDAAVRQLATGSIVISDLAPYAPARIALELLADLLEKCGVRDDVEVGQ